jgi:hypothetical protein
MLEGAMGERPVEFSHYANKPVTKVRSAKQEAGAGMKPRGFWFSVDDPASDSPTWASWCESESHSIGPLRHVLTLQPSARIRHVKTVRQLDAFHGEFCAAIYPGGDANYIDWSRVASKYQAIIIAPYLWDWRFCRDACWYYSWDVASGCIWDASAIASIELFNPPSRDGGRR